MSDSTEVQQDSAAQSAPVDTKDAPADSQTLEEAPAVPADAQPVAEQPQEVPQKAVEPEPQTGGWASWFQRVRQSAEQAVAICKHDLLEMTAQIKEDTTEAVESRSLFPTPSPHNSLFILNLVHNSPPRHGTQRSTPRRTWRTSPRQSTTSSALSPRPSRPSPRCLRASTPPPRQSTTHTLSSL